ncbi:hypothetical protein R1sor_018601 [Riccia sorocarpa]|uniref:Uncharacterized protein n=1 Tax=Riccia sorocarpa TaxID=122646 RepID=A0ABD3IGD7_9MARC
MAEQNVAHAEDNDDCSLYGSWIWSVAGALIAIPLGIRKKSFAPLVFYGSTGAMIDIWVGLSNCERARQEQLQAKAAAASSAEGENVTVYKE